MGAQLVFAAFPPATGATTRTNFTVTPWDNRQGLPHRTVISLAQARDGYLWVGTYQGLARFDGIRFTVFDEDEAPGLSSGSIAALFADSHGNLWVGTDAEGTMLIKDGQVRPLDIGSRGREGRLVAGCEDTNGVVWLATANGQLCRYRDGHMDVWSRPEFMNARSVIIEPAGRLVLATFNALFALDPAAIESGKDLPPSLTFVVRGRIDYLLASHTAGFWLLANNSVRQLQFKQADLEALRDFGPYPWTNAPVWSACEDRAGNLIVGTQDRGLTWFDAQGNSVNLTGGNGLTHSTVLALCMDREGGLWVGTDNGGLNRVKRQLFGVLPVTRGDAMQTVCAAGDGGLWFAASGGELRHLRGGELQAFGPEQGLVNPNVRSICADRAGKIWVGTFGSGLLQVVGDKVQPAPQADRLPRNISVLHEDRQSQLWVGTDRGLARWDGRAWKAFSAADGLANGQITALADDAAGNLWIGTAGGLSRLRGGEIRTFHKADGLPTESVSALLADADGALWVGTRGRGLAKFAEGKWTRFTKRDGLASDSINYLAQDAAGDLWIGSAAGLTRLETRALVEFARGRTQKLRCRTYVETDGLLTRECSAGSQPAAARGGDGTMWFCTTRGLASVNPAELSPNTNQPPVRIEAVFVDDAQQNTNAFRLDWPSTITLSAGRKRLEIHYTSLNLLTPEQTRFRYKLEPFETDWTEAGDTRVAHYSKVPAGEYRFQVTAANEDGIWNETGAVLGVVVEPPFWQKRWFIALTAVILLGSIVGTVHLISTQKLQRQLAHLRQQEALEKERARIARDLHDQLGANLTQISLLGEMAESDKDVPEEVEASAKQIVQTARQTSAALDEIVWAANPANDTLDSLVTYCCKYAQEYLALAGLSYRIEAPDHLPATPIAPEVRHNLFLAFKESVNNIVKHAQATTARVRLTHDAGSFTFEIEDNGRGLAKGDWHKGRNGLRNMRKRMEDVGGAFHAGPAPERGTVIRLTARLGPRAPTHNQN